MPKTAPGKQKTAKKANIGNLLTENRKFKPTASFTRKAHANTQTIYRTAKTNPVKFWEKMASCMGTEESTC